MNFGTHRTRVRNHVGATMRAERGGLRTSFSEIVHRIWIPSLA